MAPPHPCPQAGPWLGRGPVPSPFPGAQLIPCQGPPAPEPISACRAGAPHLSPCPWPPRGPALPRSLQAPPSAREADASSIAPFRKRTGAHFLSEKLGEIKPVREASRHQDVSQPWLGRPRSAVSPPQAPPSLPRLPPSPRPGATAPPPWVPLDRGCWWCWLQLLTCVPGLAPARKEEEEKKVLEMVTKV